MSQSPIAPTGLAVSVIDVSDAAGLKAALAAATGGEIIRLAAGNYGSLVLRDFHVPVTLQSDPDAPAVLAGFDIDNVDGLTLDGLSVDYVYKVGTGTWTQCATIHDSKAITIRNTVFDGDLASGTGTGADGAPTGRGLSIVRSDGVVIENSEVRSFWKGIAVSGSTNVTLRGNDIHGMRSDGMSITAVDNLLIEDNHFHDRAKGPGADHPDFIQTLTRGSTVPITNMTIRGNLFDVGSGDYTQSLFLTNSAVSDGAGEEMWLRNILIENNVILADHLHGITVGAADGLVVRNNTVLHAGREGAEETAQNADIPRINLDAQSMNVTVSGNVTGGFVGYTGQAGWQVEGNFVVQNRAPELANHYSNHFLAPYGQLGGHPEKLMLRADSPIALAGAGAPAMVYDPKPDHLTALILPEEQANRAAWLFDARLTA